MSEMLSYLEGNIVVQKVLISVGLLFLNLILIRFMSRILFKTIKTNSVYYTTRKRLSYFNTVILLVVIVLIWSGSKLDLATYVGFISAGIAISLRELFTNMAAWLIIVFQKPFEVGDRITVNDMVGDVIDIKVFQTVLMEVSAPERGQQSTGQIVHIPNNFLFLHGIVNANKGFVYIWNEIEVRLTLDSSWELAKRKLEEIINHHTLHLSKEAEENVIEASKRYMLHYTNLTPIVFVRVQGGYLYLTIRYLCEPRQARMTENLIWQEILTAFSETTEIQMA
ncbi:mechanosensitive ion channel domain-containing protein [Fusibacter ferrireducens]|uniref:Mechanosensitive ion channel n=1 Tax=Fusibacter ferrireducens TaxID=2785058 RepID=A0ABR9ZWY1_9FIRM|nr:mechanosensitive ion channel domain-containing protein [Fusibacter ferrireducens]MBF4694972.1 mechanosensitive ion channel [Fusibacter ferrireducens]